MSNPIEGKKQERHTIGKKLLFAELQRMWKVDQRKDFTKREGCYRTI